LLIFSWGYSLVFAQVKSVGYRLNLPRRVKTFVYSLTSSDKDSVSFIMKIKTIFVISLFSLVSQLGAETPVASVAGDWWRSIVTVRPRPANLALNFSVAGADLKFQTDRWQVYQNLPMPQVTLKREGTTDVFKSVEILQFTHVKGGTPLTPKVPVKVVLEVKSATSAVVKLVRVQGGQVVQAKEVVNGRDTFVPQSWNIER